MMNQFKYVILGGGVAGDSAVEGISEHDHSGSIALCGMEHRLPYDRPPLSKGLWLGKAKLESDVNFHRGIIPTAENMAITFWRILNNNIHGGTLYAIKLYESDNNVVEYRGE